MTARFGLQTPGAGCCCMAPPDRQCIGISATCGCDWGAFSPRKFPNHPEKGARDGARVTHGALAFRLLQTVHGATALPR